MTQIKLDLCVPEKHNRSGLTLGLKWVSICG